LPSGPDPLAAVRFRRLAEDADDPWVRAILLDLADDYEALAHEDELAIRRFVAA
jgi:hypothetical protein